MTTTMPVRAILVTARETEVIQAIAAGHTNDEIAGQLGISPRTVKSYVERLKLKLSNGSLLTQRRLLPGAFMEATGRDPYPRNERS